MRWGLREVDPRKGLLLNLGRFLCACDALIDPVRLACSFMPSGDSGISMSDLRGHKSARIGA